MCTLAENRKRRTLAHIGPATICAFLLFVFAIGAKVAPYHSQDPGQKSLASTKLCVGKVAASDISADLASTSRVFTLAISVLSMLWVLQGSTELLMGTQEAGQLPPRFPPFVPLAVRPPPFR